MPKNVNVCYSFSETSDQSYSPLYLGETVLKQVETFKYLGVLLSSDISWSAHVQSVCSKARKLVGLLYRQFYTSNANRDTMLKMYTAIIRPHLEYAAQVWDLTYKRTLFS